MSGEGTDVLDVVRRRWSVLERLLDGPTYKRDLVAAVEHSRSTVDRAVRELADAGLVERTSGGYTATAAGRLAAEEYRAATASLAAVEDAVVALAPLPHDAPLAAPLLADATVTVADGAPTADALADRFRERAADAGRVLLGTEAPPAFATGIAEVADGTVLVPDELVDTGTEGAVEATAPAPFSLARTPDAVAVLVHDAGAPHALVETDTDDALAWADDRLDDCDPTRGGGDGTVPAEPALAARGVERLDAAAFDERRARGLVTALRAGQGFADVAAGHALPRERSVPDGDGERERVDEVIAGRLAAGADVALVGPAGSGKSTVCRQVAHRWVRDDRGPVWHRRGDRGAAFDDPGELARALRTAPGHALVVVEDAVRGGRGAFETMLTFRDDPTVSVLVAARSEEWADPPGEPLPPAAQRHRHESVELVRMPPLDERERERFVAHVAAALDRSPADLADAVRAVESGDESHSAPAAVLGFLHCLAAVAGVGDDVPSALEADARATLAELRAGDAATYDLGVLVNLLNAGGIAVMPAYCYALVAPPASHEPAAVDAAVEALHGRVLFGESPLEGRMPHEEWSVAFLTALVEAEPGPAVRRRTGRVFLSLCALADDPAAREAVREALGAEDDALDAIAADPSGWADDLLVQLSGVVERRPALVPVLGNPERGLEVPPDACTAAAIVRSLDRRCQARFDRGDYDALREEATTLYHEAGRLSDPERTRFRAAAYRHRAWAAIRTSDYDAADRYAAWALALSRGIDDRNGAQHALSACGVAAWLGGDLDAAERHLRAAERHADPETDPLGAASVRNNLGLIHYERGAFDAAVERFERSRALRERAGAVLPLVDSLINLGVIERDRGRPAAAIERFESAVELARGVGGRDVLAHALRALGNTLAERGRAEAATERLTEALDLAREAGNRENEAHCLRGLSVAARERGDLDAAAEYLTESRATAAAIEADRALTLALRELGTLARERGDPDAALDHLGECLETFDHGVRNAETARAHRERGEALLDLGECEAARAAFRSARDQFRALGADDSAADCEARAEATTD